MVDGIGEDFMPKTVWWDYIDQIVTIDDKTAYAATMELARNEALFTGSSGGAAAAGARAVAEAVEAGTDASDVAPPDAVIVTLFPDSGERYLSKLNEDWMRAQGLLD